MLVKDWKYLPKCRARTAAANSPAGRDLRSPLSGSCPLNFRVVLECFSQISWVGWRGCLQPRERDPVGGISQQMAGAELPREECVSKRTQALLVLVPNQVPKRAPFALGIHPVIFVKLWGVRVVGVERRAEGTGTGELRSPFPSLLLLLRVMEGGELWGHLYWGSLQTQQLSSRA